MNANRNKKGQVNGSALERDKEVMDILVVEDDLGIAQAIVKNIDRWGHNAEISTTGKDAREKIRRASLDVAVVSVFLPDTKGHELIPHLKEAWPNIWIVTMTDYNTREVELKVREQGIVYYMAKPFEAMALKEILDHRSKKREEVA